jgi:hypothetical protein
MSSLGSAGKRRATYAALSKRAHPVAEARLASDTSEYSRDMKSIDPVDRRVDTWEGSKEEPRAVKTPNSGPRPTVDVAMVILRSFPSPPLS